MGRPVVIVGGYGAVGQRLAARLVERGREVVVAGRRLRRARAVAESLNCRFAQIDVRDSTSWVAAIPPSAIVVCCVDQQDVELVRWVLETGRHYVDITASDEFFRRVEQLDDLARRRRSTGVLSVGLTPGLTNLMVKAAIEKLPHTQEVEIAVLLGLGEQHGAEGTRWVLHRLANAPRQWPLPRVAFPGLDVPAAAVPLDIADQHVVRRTLGLENVRTVVTLGSSFWTLLAASAGPLFRWALIRRITINLMPLMIRGDERWVVVVTAIGTDPAEEIRISFEGDNEADATARVAARVVEQLARRLRPGVHHIEQLLELEDVVPHLKVVPMGRQT